MGLGYMSAKQFEKWTFDEGRGGRRKERRKIPNLQTYIKA